MKTYHTDLWKTFRDDPRLILFGLLATFFTGPGQSYLISFFLPGIQSDLRLSSSQVGDLYFVATLGGSLVLPLIGRLMDRSDLGRLSLLMGFFLAFGCVLMSLAVEVWGLVAGLLLIRCFGQGALSVISSTAVARRFGQNRGKALSLVTQGYPLAEVILPIIISTWLIYYDWRSGWVLLAAMILVFYMPASFFLLKPVKGRALPQAPKMELAAKVWTMQRILLDYRFYFAMASALVLPGALTGLFFYQVEIALAKSWDIRVMATAFIFFGVSRSLLGLSIGHAIDRWTGRSLLGFVGIPFLLGLIVLRFGEMEWTAYCFLFLAGVSVGAGGNARTAFWAEAYGVKHLGALRGLIAFLMVLSTAVSTPIFGRLLDWGTPIDRIVEFVIALSLLGVIFGFISSILYRPAS